jgi:hypothetical protein
MNAAPVEPEVREVALNLPGQFRPGLRHAFFQRDEHAAALALGEDFT